MAHMDIFNDDAFSLVSMTKAVEKMPYQPGFLGSLGLFESEGITTDVASIEEVSGTLSLIKTTERGGPIVMGTTDRRKMRNFNLPRVAKGDQIFAREVQGVRAFGTETELETVQGKVGKKQKKLKQDLEYTMEFHRLGALQGILLDADGSEIYDYFDEFGVTPPTEIDFNLDAASPAKGALRTLVADSVKRPIIRALGQVPTSMGVVALCGDDFFDAFINHQDVYRTYENWEAASALREAPVFETFRIFGIDWINYRGSDDNSTIAIGTDKVKFVPKGVPGLYRRINGPGETEETVNTEGLDHYSLLVRDRDRSMWVQPEVYAYPLHICTRPEVLLTGRRT